MNNLICLSSLLLISSIAILNATEKMLASFGEPCDESNRCDCRASLACSSNGTCHCLKETGMIYLWQSKKCVVLAGERCNYSAVEILTDNENKLHENRHAEKLTCVDNAVCNDDGYCNCTSEFFQNSEGGCQHKLGFGNLCGNHEECKGSFVCINSKCSCKGSDWTYDSQKDGCYIKAGSSGCRWGNDEGSQSCVANSRCILLPSNNNTKCQCQSSSFSKTNPGKEAPGFIEKDGLCYSQYGTYNCHPTLSPCMDGFACINNMCRCPYPEYQIFDSDTQTCLSKLHGPCFETIRSKAYNFSCFDNTMECKRNHEIYECACKFGYQESKSGNKCAGEYGSPCKDLNDCDQFIGLRCQEGVCRCGDFEEYDSSRSDRNECKGLVGAKCGSNLGERRINCVYNAECVRSRNDKLPGVCRCNSGYEVDSNRRCKRRPY